MTFNGSFLKPIHIMDDRSHRDKILSENARKLMVDEFDIIKQDGKVYKSSTPIKEGLCDGCSFLEIDCSKIPCVSGDKDVIYVEVTND